MGSRSASFCCISTPCGQKGVGGLSQSLIDPYCCVITMCSAMSRHLGGRVTFPKIATNFWLSRMPSEVYNYVRKCDFCQRAKPAQNARVGMHAASPCTRPMERLFIDFVGPLTGSKRGKIAILVEVDAFSKFVTFLPIRMVSFQAVLDCLERWYFQAFGTPTLVVTDNARFSAVNNSEICVFGG